LITAKMRRTGHYSITRDRGGPRGGWQRGPTGHGPVGRWGQSATEYLDLYA